MLDARDFALLNDALDGRLDAPAMEALRRRIHDEADLAAAWEDLQRIRRALRALPAPAVPAGFLEGVHARASAADSASNASASSAPGGGGLSLVRRWTYAAAAVVGLGVGLSVYVASQRSQEAGHTETAQEPQGAARGKSRDGEGAARRIREEGGVRKNLEPSKDSLGADEGPGTPSESGGAKATATPPVRFGPPGGSAPPGLRPPSDAPVVPPPGEILKVDAESPPAAPAPAPERAASPPSPPPPTSTGPTAKDGRLASGGTRRAGGKSVGDSAARETSLRLRATDFDEARARISLLVAAIRRGDAVEADRGRVALGDSIEDAIDDEKKLEAGDAHGQDEKAKEADKSAAGGAPSAATLGSFVFSLTPDEARRLTEALTGAPRAKSLDAAAEASKSVSVRVLVVSR